jgi:hypothetical protein
MRSFDYHFGFVAVAPELWAIRDDIRTLAKAAPRYFEDINEIHEMESAFCDIFQEKGIGEQWTLGVFNAAFDGCGFRKGGTWYA